MKAIVNHMIQVTDIDSIRQYSKDSNVGSLLFIPESNSVYTLNKCNEVLEILPIKDGHKTVYHTPAKPTNCKNCGAPLTSYKCEYCGTEY